VSAGERRVIARCARSPTFEIPEWVPFIKLFRAFSYTTTFVPFWWIQQTGTWRAWAPLLTCSEGEDNSLPPSPLSSLLSPLSSLLSTRSDHPTFRPVSLSSSSLFPRAPSPPSWRSEKPRLKTYSLGRNPTVTRGRLTERKTVLETTRGT
jgi:hypothetical protein